MKAIKNNQASQSSWVSLTAFFALASLVEVILFSTLTAFTPVYLKYIGFDDPAVKFWTGILASVGMLLGFWFVPMWGVLADRYGRKPLIVRSFAVEAVACVIMALAPNIWVFTLGRMLTGLALGNTGLMFASLSDHAPRRRVGLAIALVTGSQPLGSVFGSLFGGAIVSAFGITALWWFNVFIISAVFGLLVLFYHEPFTRKITPPLTRMLRDSLCAAHRARVVVGCWRDDWGCIWHCRHCDVNRDAYLGRARGQIRPCASIADCHLFDRVRVSAAVFRRDHSAIHALLFCPLRVFARGQ
ncbi:MAG: hypothetical protein B6D41_05805 [Chloroflexi bacterium UTCFX4]|nr:MAG: hypothetical protein B6D41_05805 [Chloroflexi bacterium UTCFX4]